MSLANVDRVSVLQIEVQMGAVLLVGFRPEHGGEHLTSVSMDAMQKFGWL
jgi:hypothetical protein